MTGALSVGRLPDGIAFAVTGRGTFVQSRALDQMVEAFRAQCPDGRIVIDLSRCEYLDSTFLGCLVAHGRPGCAARAGLSILVSEQGQRQLFGSSRLDRFLPLEIGSTEPVEGWQPLANSASDQRQIGLHVLQTHRTLGALDIPDAAAFRSIAEQVSKELQHE